MLLVRRPVARAARLAVGTAVVAGTAGVVNHKMDQHYANQANAQMQQQQVSDMQAQQEQLAYQQQQLAMQQQAMQQQAALAAQQQQAALAAQQAPAAQIPAASSADAQIAELQKWAELQKQGIISADEFAAKKAQILGI